MRPHDADFNEDFSGFEKVVDLIESLVETPDPDLRVAQIEAAAEAALGASVHPLRQLVSTSIGSSLGRAAAVLLAFVLSMSGLAAASALPAPMQNAVASVADHFGIHFPTDDTDDLASNDCEDADSGREADGGDTTDNEQCATDDAELTNETEVSDDESDDHDGSHEEVEDNESDDDSSDGSHEGDEADEADEADEQDDGSHEEAEVDETDDGSHKTDEADWGSDDESDDHDEMDDD